jgi:perosamine synthetase
MIPVNEPVLDGNEKKYLNQCIDSGWISSEGPFVEAFENSFARYVGRKYAIAVSNGTAALDAAIEALDIQFGDEVILPAFTIISCVNQIVRSGANPVLIDSYPDTWNMNVDVIEGKITKKTKAILVVHIYGLPTDMAPILSLAKKYNLKVIEDAAEAHGQTYCGKCCGSFGDISTFSFYPNKLITTGEGGMVLTDDPDLAERIRGLRNLCFQSDKRFVHERLGWNLRITNLQAAVGLAQLERIREFAEKKRRMGKIYNELLAGLPGVKLPLEKTAYADNIYWIYGLEIDRRSNLNSESVRKLLTERGIGNRPFFYPLNLQPVLKRLNLFEGESYPIAEHLYDKGFYIPSGLGITEPQMEEVALNLWSIFR